MSLTKRIKKISLLLLTILVLSCTTVEESVREAYVRPVPPSIPVIVFEDIPGYYGIKEEDINLYFDFMLSYKEYRDNVKSTFDKYDGVDDLEE